MKKMETIQKKIVTRNGKFFVMSEDGSKKLGGPYDTKDEAVNRLRQVEGHKMGKSEELKVTADFIKAEPTKQIVYGVVLEPDVIDSQGDIIKADEIERAAHAFMEKSQVIGNQHSEVAKAVVVENYISPMEFTLGEETVRKGTWIMAVKVLDEELWEGVKKGEYTGFSIGGRGVRTKVEIEQESSTENE